MAYRPYSSAEEMKHDFYQRMWEKDFAGDHTEWNPMCNPIIWIKSKSGGEYMITGFVEEGITFSPPFGATWQKLFEDFTYLDNSPIGKEERSCLNIEEMKRNFYQRVWKKTQIKDKNSNEYMIIGFDEEKVILDTLNTITWRELFEDFTYLDGSPLNKEE